MCKTRGKEEEVSEVEVVKERGIKLHTKKRRTRRGGEGEDFWDWDKRRRESGE